MINMIGVRVGKLLISEYAGTRGTARHALWKCICDCGNETIAVGSYLRMGRIKSCGCGSKETRFTKERLIKHGKSRDPIYKIWRSMISRTTTKTKKSHLYFEKGIRVCERWLSFENFYADMGDRPEGKSLDRIDGNKGYSPENCRWASSEEQANNTSKNHLITAFGKTMTFAMWGRETGIKPNTILSRMRRGWSAEKSLTKI